MAALPPGGAHAAGAADPMQVDQPLPAAAAAAAHAPADAKVSGFFCLPVRPRWRVVPAARSGCAGLPDLSAPPPPTRFVYPASCLVVPSFDPSVDLRRARRGEARSSCVPLPRDFSWEEVEGAGGALLAGEEMRCLPAPCVRAMQASRPLFSPDRLALACRLGAPLHTGVLGDHDCVPNGGIKLGNSFLDDYDS